MRADQLALLAAAPACPLSSKTSTRMPSARAWISPRHTGPIGLPPTKQPTMSVPPEIDARCTSRLMLLVDEVEALGRERRSGGRDRADRVEPMRVDRREAGLGDGVDELRGGAEQRHPGLVGEVEQRVAVGMERRAVVEQQRRLRRERRDQPVPHHPAAGREVEHPVARRGCRSGADAPSGAGSACRRRRARCTWGRRSCPTRTGCRADD